MSGAALHSVLLNADTARELLALHGLSLDELEITYRRVLDDNGVAAYRLRGRGPDGADVRTFGYARWAPPERLAEMSAKWLGDRAESSALGAGVRALPEAGALLFLAPNDRGLGVLRDVCDLARLKRVLAPLPDFAPAGVRIREKKSALDVRRYKPEQRLVARATLGLLHEASGESRELDTVIRVFADTRGERLAREVTAWRAAGAALHLPRPLGAVSGGHVYVEEAFRGDTLRTAIRGGQVSPQAFDTALATLHESAVALEGPRSPATRLADAERALAVIELSGAVPAENLTSLAHALARALPLPVAPQPIHGDLHARQILVQDEHIVFVDLERASPGDPLDDAGNLIAHLEWERRTDPEGEAAGAFARAFRELFAARHAARSARDLAFYTAVALIEIAELPVRRRLAEASERTGLALAMATQTLSAAG